MFFRRRRPPFLLYLILLVLGVKVGRHCCSADPAKKEEMKSKARLFRSKLKEAFSVWEPDEKKEGGEAPAEQQG
ncbi:MAG TPA: hypothetical protein VD969_17400 [Symbiobacteriaceae bacterium]|nr:hypothetical protein [Symbiobacteriaceae bacterium]